MSTGKLSRREFLMAAGAAAAATALAACAPAPAPGATPQAPVGAQPAATPAPGREVTISFMGWGGVEEDQGVRAAIEVFQKETPGVKVTWLHTPERYHDKMMALIAARTPPDTAFISTGQYMTFAHGGTLLDITDKIKGDPVIGRKGYFIEPQEEQRCTYRGRWYGIGSCWVAPHIYYNADVFEQARIEPPSNDPAKAWSWDHFVEVSRQLTADANGRRPGESGFDGDRIDRWAANWPTWSVPLHAAIQSNRGRWIDPETGLLDLDKPAAVEAIQRIADLRLVHRVMPHALAFEQLGMNVTQMLEAGKLAMVIDGSWALAWTTKIKAKLGTAVLPKMQVPATDMQAHLHSAFAATKEPEASWKWLRFLATEFYQLRFLRMGLWLPSQTDLMTPQGLAKWMTLRKGPEDGVHPAGYEQIVTEYVPKHGRVLYMPPGWPEVGAVLTPAWDAIWVGDKKAADALPPAVVEGNKILQAAVAS